MEIFYTLLFFIYGLVFGSFFNVVGLRIPKKESIFTRSHCSTCASGLKARELVPVFSYIWCRGKCRNCHTKIHPLYPIVELSTAILFSISYRILGFEVELLIALLFFSMLMIISVSDISYMLIPNKILWFFGSLIFILRINFSLFTTIDGLIGACIGFTILFCVAILSKGGIGGGDLKLFLIIGFVLGTPQTLLALFLSSLIGLVVSFIVLRFKGLGRKTPIPFGPSIALATMITYFWGADIVERYMNLF
ncbi:MAG TPA: prepilin peptidase [Sporosarcina sp.]|nr:prepilin peptidase [Sporosarcina sp.]